MANTTRKESTLKHRNNQRRMKQRMREGRERSKGFRSHADYDIQNKLRQSVE